MRDLILHSYAFLRNQELVEFNDPKATDAVLNFIEAPLPPPDDSTPPTRQSTSTDSSAAVPIKCSHCNSNTFHAKVRPRIRDGKNYCPFKNETVKVARKARALINEKAKKTGWTEYGADIIEEYIGIAKASV